MELGPSPVFLQNIGHALENITTLEMIIILKIMISFLEILEVITNKKCARLVSSAQDEIDFLVQMIC